MTLRRFFGAILAWSIVGIVQSLTRYIDKKNYDETTVFSLTDMLLFIMTYSFWVIITLLLLHFIVKLRYPFKISMLFTLFILGLIFWIPTYLFMEFSASAIIAKGSFGDVINNFSTVTGSLIYFYALIYTLTFVACLGIVLSQKTKISEKINASLKQQQTESDLLLSEQKIQLVQSQLGPHFLFNCLGAISGLARKGDKETLIDATARVGDLLRFIISNSTVTLITLEEEIAFVNDYVSLQRLRFGNRFKFVSTITLPDRQLMCPPFTVQPLIENAFCHAVEATEENIVIDLSISHTNERLTVTACNNIVEKEVTTKGNGTGLTSLKTRLQHVYENDYEMIVENQENQYCITLHVPFADAENA